MEAVQHSLHFTTQVMVVEFDKKDRLCLHFYESIADLLATLLDICKLGYGTFAHNQHLPSPVNPILSSTFMGYLFIV